MAKSWRHVRTARGDLTDYVIHWTRDQPVNGDFTDAFTTLKVIVACGYLKPSYAPKLSMTVGGQQITIKGPHPAVCFTEQPLGAFFTSCEVLPSRYYPYGVAVHKWHLFKYGGRPVLYGSDDLLKALPDEYKYLWARYDPIPEPLFGGYPVDWTHEREWRARARPHSYGDLGLSPSEGVPLLLPPVPYPRSKKPVLSLPRLLVRTKSESEELREWIAGSLTYDGGNSVLSYYFGMLAKVMVIPLEEVERRLREGDIRCDRLDTLPYEEIDPAFETPTPETYL